MEALAPTLNLARERGLDLALVHDPDADRLAVAATRDGLMTPLSGDQTGTILADLLLPEAGKGAHVATTLVSTRMVDRVAERHSADVIRTPTGFKWMAEQARRLEALV